MRAARQEPAAESVDPRPAATPSGLSIRDVACFLIELAVYSGVSVAALRLVNGVWSSLSPAGLLVAAVSIVVMACVWARWAAPHASRRPAPAWSALLEYGWLALGVAGWLVAGVPAIAIPLAAGIAALASRRAMRA